MVFPLLFSVHTIYSCNLKYTCNWDYDADTKSVVADLVKEAGSIKNTANQVSLGANYLNTPSINYYRSVKKLDWLAEVKDSGVSGDYDYYFFDETQRSDILFDNIQIVKSYPFTKKILGKAGENEIVTVEDALKVGVLKLESRKFNEAIKYFKMVLDKFPGNFYANFHTGRAYIGLDDNSTARQYLTKSLEINPGDKEVYFHLGLISINVKEFANAVENYLDVLKIDPDYTLAWYNLGVSYWSLVDYQKANHAFVQASRLEPDNQLFKKMVLDTAKLKENQ